MSTSAFKLVHVEDVQTRIENERLDATEMEWQRHARVWRCALATMSACEQELQAMVAAPFTPKPEDLASIAERLNGLSDLLGGWLRSPKTMAEEKSNGNR